VKNRAIIFFLTTWILASLGHSTQVEFIINAESDYIVAPVLSTAESNYYYAQATMRAVRNCHQALGTNAKTRFLQQWTSIQEGALVHNSNIMCSRNFDLNEEDPSIGAYLKHARWILEIFFGQTVDDHQLVENTIKILSQIGAPAMAALWNAHVEQPDSATKQTYFLCAMEEIIDAAPSDDFSTFEEVLKIITQHDRRQLTSDGEFVSFRKQKRKLLARGRWPI